MTKNMAPEHRTFLAFFEGSLEGIKIDDQKLYF
jgi:hypothetical protein